MLHVRGFFDRVRQRAMLSRVGIALGEGTDALLGPGQAGLAGRSGAAGLAPGSSRSCSSSRTGRCLLALDLLDRVLYAVVYRHLDEAALLGGAALTACSVQHLSAWFTDQRKLVDALF